MSILTPKIIRSNRASLSLQISSGGELIIKAPFFMPDMMIRHFIKNKEAWILKTLKKFEGREKKEKTYSEGEEFLFLGDIYKLHIGDSKEINVKNGILEFPDFMKFRIKKELTNWYMRQAKEYISERVEYMSKKMDTNYKNIRFSDTSSKWGSCFPDNSLQFNWRLIMTPITVINYVVIHELVHTKEKHHQDAFWRKVRLYTPAYKQHSKWLDLNKHLLSV